MWMWSPKLQNLPPQGKKHGAKSGLKNSSQNTYESHTKSHKSKTGQSETETKSNLAKDKSPSHPLPPTLVVSKMHKEAQQAAGGLTSLGATSEEGAHPQLNSDEETKNYSFDHIFVGSNPNVLVDKTKYALDGLKTTHTNSSTNEEYKADDISKKIKLEDLSEFLKDISSTFFTTDSPQDEPIIITDESKEEDATKNKLVTLLVGL
nr:hypothetical protein [Tanacetum cinerariifolium]